MLLPSVYRTKAKFREDKHMKHFPIKRVMAAGLIACTLLSGCAQTKRSSAPVKNDPNVKTEINLNEVSNKSFDKDKMNAEYGRYSFELMAKIAADADTNCNIMISPASIMMALDMCAAGAKGKTLKQLTDLFAKDADPLEQQAFASELMKRINNAQKIDFSCANAIWSNETFLGDKMNIEYKNYIQKTFSAEFRSETFGPDTHNEINKWVDEKTNHMIKDIVPALDPSTVMVLVNAIRFEAKWQTAYEDSQVLEYDFNGTKETKKTTMLSSSEYGYFMTGKATGFMKYYDGDEYAFLAILPKDKKANANDFIKDFTYADYKEFVDSRVNMSVNAVMPEFKSDYEAKINDNLKALGVTDAFDAKNADLSGIAKTNRNLYISRVMHKTHIEVDRKGTKAAAVTSVEVDACESDEAHFEEVICNRPYAYAIVDIKTMNPIFIGTVNNVEKN